MPQGDDAGRPGSAWSDPSSWTGRHVLVLTVVVLIVGVGFAVALGDPPGADEEGVDGTGAGASTRVAHIVTRQLLEPSIRQIGNGGEAVWSGVGIQGPNISRIIVDFMVQANGPFQGSVDVDMRMTTPDGDTQRKTDTSGTAGTSFAQVSFTFRPFVLDPAPAGWNQTQTYDGASERSALETDDATWQHDNASGPYDFRIRVDLPPVNNGASVRMVVSVERYHAVVLVPDDDGDDGDDGLTGDDGDDDEGATGGEDGGAMDGEDETVRDALPSQEAGSPIRTRSADSAVGPLTTYMTGPRPGEAP